MTPPEPVTFQTKVAIVLREDLEPWQKLNVTAFLMSGLVGASPDIIGEPYEDGSGNRYLPLSGQPTLVFAASPAGLRRAFDRASARGVALAIYTEEMFETGHDAANRAAVRARPREELNLVGIGLRDLKKTVDKALDGLKLHP